MPSIFLTRDQIELDEELPELPYECIWHRPIDKGRWEIHYEGVFEYLGKHYMIYWQRPATEMQECDPWYNEDEIECFEVELQEVTVKKWVIV